MQGSVLVMRDAIMASNALHGHGLGCECLLSHDARLALVWHCTALVWHRTPRSS